MIIQLFYVVLNTYAEYADAGFEIYDSIPKTFFTAVSILSVLAWGLIFIFFIGLLNKTK